MTIVDSATASLRLIVPSSYHEAFVAACLLSQYGPDTQAGPRCVPHERSVFQQDGPFGGRDQNKKHYITQGMQGLLTNYVLTAESIVTGALASNRSHMQGGDKVGAVHMRWAQAW